MKYKLTDVDKKILSLERDYYIDFFRRGNSVTVSVRNKGFSGEQKGGIALQYTVKLEDLLCKIAEDLDERGTATSV